MRISTARTSACTATKALAAATPVWLPHSDQMPSVCLSSFGLTDLRSAFVDLRDPLHDTENRSARPHRNTCSQTRTIHTGAAARSKAKRAAMRWYIDGQMGPTYVCAYQMHPDLYLCRRLCNVLACNLLCGFDLPRQVIVRGAAAAYQRGSATLYDMSFPPAASCCQRAVHQREQ